MHKRMRGTCFRSSCSIDIWRWAEQAAHETLQKLVHPRKVRCLQAAIGISRASYYGVGRSRQSLVGDIIQRVRGCHAQRAGRFRRCYLLSKHGVFSGPRHLEPPSSSHKNCWHFCWYLMMQEPADRGNARCCGVTSMTPSDRATPAMRFVGIFAGTLQRRHDAC